MSRATYLGFEQALQGIDHVGIYKDMGLVQIHHDARRVLVNGQNHLLHCDIAASGAPPTS